jgi:uncharacterized membrane protein (DUF4010 family)
MPELLLANLLVALGIGLLVGVERERNKGDGPDRAMAGVRTFATTALLGAVCLRVGGELLLAVAVAALCVFSLRGRDSRLGGDGGDPGLTTEVALLLTLLLGGLAVAEPALASGLGVTLAVLLASKSWLHHFVKSVVTEQEMWDALIIAAASLVILPLLPDRYLGPFDAINPRTTGTLVVLIMAVSAAGHVASRALGARLGLPAAGFASGFVSSTATVAAMGTRFSARPDMQVPAAAAAILSSVATIIQLFVVLGATNPAVMGELMLPLSLAGAAALGYAALFAMRGLKSSQPLDAEPGSAFSIGTALLLAVTLSGIVMLSAGMEQWLGRPGVLVAALVSGFGDVHSTSVSMASLASSGRMSAQEAVLPILIALSANTLGKAVVAGITGGKSYLRSVAPGLMLMLAAAWAGYLL